MKKYIIPCTEAFEAICGAALCLSDQGAGQKDNPIPGTGGGPQGAPSRATILYI